VTSCAHQDREFCDNLELIMKATSLQRSRSPGLSHSVVFAVLVVAALFTLVPAGATAQAVPELAGESLVQVLRQGGFTIYFRHEATNWSQSDDIRQSGDWLSCDGNEVRQLSTAGRQSATLTGQAIGTLGIPVGRVLASPYCRTVETARLMNLGEVEPSTDVINLRVDDYFGGRPAVVATARDLLGQAPKGGTNTVVVAHGNVAQAATSVYPAEGEGLVFEAGGQNGFRFIGRLKPAEWQELVNTLKP
jgi:phosphohistidine phosphatase SixA